MCVCVCFFLFLRFFLGGVGGEVGGWGGGVGGEGGGWAGLSKFSCGHCVLKGKSLHSGYKEGP